MCEWVRELWMESLVGIDEEIVEGSLGLVGHV